MKRRELSREEQETLDAQYWALLQLPAVRARLGGLGQHWEGGRAAALARAVGVSIEQLQRLEAGELVPAEQLVPLVHHQPGEFAEISGAIVRDMPGLREKVAEELKRVSSWTKLANFTEIIDLLATVDDQAAGKMKACADPEQGFMQFCPTGHYCHFCNKRCWLRICPNCAKAIADRLRDKLTAVLSEVEKAAPPGAALKHMTPTIKRTPADVAGLSSMAALIAQSEVSRADLEELHDMNKDLQHELISPQGKWAGASAYLEFGPLGGNVHAHNIVMSRFVPQALISDTWRRLSLKYRRMWRPWVEAQLAELQGRKAFYKAELKTLGKSRGVRACRLRTIVRGMSSKWMQAEICRRAKRQGKGDFIIDIRAIDAERAAGEVVKYITKLHKTDARTGRYETPVADLVALHLALKGKRRAWSWGSFYNVDLVEPEPEFEAGTCPECGAILLGATMEDLRAALHLRFESNCRPRLHLGGLEVPLLMGSGP